LRGKNGVDTWAAPATDTNAEFAAIAAGVGTLEETTAPVEAVAGLIPTHRQ
jgi:hypothetical protein